MALYDPQTTQEPWLLYLTPDASPAQIAFAKKSWTQGYRPTWDATSGTYNWNQTNRGVQGQPTADAGTPYFPGAAAAPAAGGAGAAAASPTAPAAKPAAPSIDDQVYADPEWIQRKGHFDAARAAVVTSYGAGIDPTTGQLLPGVDAGTAAAAAANPHSTLAQLHQQRMANDASLSNAGARHNAGLGGATQQTHINEGTADETRHAAAAASLQSNLLGIADSQDALKWAIWHRIAANPSTADPTDPTLAGSLPRTGNTSDAGGLRTIDGHPYVVQNPNLPDMEKRPYNPTSSDYYPGLKKPKKPPKPKIPRVGINPRGGNAIPTGL